MFLAWLNAISVLGVLPSWSEARTKVKANKKPEPILYKPENVKYAHIYPDGFRGGIGKTLCGSKHFGTNPVKQQEYPVNQICRRCEQIYEAGED